VLAFALTLGLTVPHLVEAPSASAAVPAAVSLKAVHFAATRKGATYRIGAEGPHHFDCSGLTQWAYRHAGKLIPRTAEQQWKASIHLRSKSSRRPGDLVFFFAGSHAYHVAMYAGHGRIWHAPKPGDRVKLVPLWTTHVRYGRVR
jgi:cell wall-associated NlpC family hydrolase